MRTQYDLNKTTAHIHTTRAHCIYPDKGTYDDVNACPVRNFPYSLGHTLVFLVHSSQSRQSVFMPECRCHALFPLSISLCNSSSFPSNVYVYNDKIENNNGNIRRLEKGMEEQRKKRGKENDRVSRRT